MKSKKVIGLALAASFTSCAFLSCAAAQAQIGGQAASGTESTSSGAQGNMGQATGLDTGKEAIQLWRPDTQNYVSPNTPLPTREDHSSKQTPYVRPMWNAGPTGLNRVSTAPMAPGTGSIGNTPIPSGSFHYGFPELKPEPYTGAYRSGQVGGMLPQVSLGSVDFNTVDTAGIAPAGMRSPGRYMGAPVPRPMMNLPTSTTSTQSTLNWLQNTFFGP